METMKASTGIFQLMHTYSEVPYSKRNVEESTSFLLYRVANFTDKEWRLMGSYAS
jgi:hypothetical protein